MKVVSDNIQLWCAERDRLKFNEGTLYNQFLTQEDFEMLRDYAQDIGQCLTSEKKYNHFFIRKLSVCSIHFKILINHLKVL